MPDSSKDVVILMLVQTLILETRVIYRFDTLIQNRKNLILGYGDSIAIISPTDDFNLLVRPQALERVSNPPFDLKVVR
jgi:hypothetical protein